MNKTNKIISVIIITLWMVGWAAPAIMGGAAWALPQDGQVAAGNSTITQPDANTMNINQTTDKSIINWQGYSIGANEKVQYIQPNSNSISLNRVTGLDPSLIYGQLSANGQVWVINPNGLLIGQNANINVGGFLGSTLNITDNNFLSGNYNFTNEAASLSSITNQGSINASNNGYVAFISPSINNSGTITANNGSVNMASGDDVTLTFANNQLINLVINKETAKDALGINNSGKITADGGQVILTAKAAGDILKTVVNNTGIIQARTIENKNGTIKLLGGMDNNTNNAITVGGTLDASAPNGGNGGFIETSAAKVHIAEDANITTYAPNGKTGTWLIDPQDYTIAASGGDITGSQLSTNLNSNNVTILSSSGGTSGSGDINVNDAVSWSANTLTLTAARDVNINAVMTASGTSALTLNTATANGADSAVTGGTVKTGFNTDGTFKGRVDFGARSGTGFLTINGNGYTVINSLGAAGSVTGTDLQGMSGNLAGYYALGSNIDALATFTWNASAGFLPVGDGTTPFTGAFDGLGHTITGLTINRLTSNVGLFGVTNGAVMRNVGLVGSSVTGNGIVGVLAGYGNWNSTISNSYSTGSDVTGNGWDVGGLVGAINAGAITNSYSTGSVTSPGYYVGGLAGATTSSTITNSYSTASVTGNGSGWYVGGLAGINANSGVITSSYSSGAVTNSGNYTGGLVGSNDSGTITNAYSTGSVSGSWYVGGLVGMNTNAGTIANTYSAGAVSGSGIVGGLVGANGATVTNSYWDTTTSGRATSAGGAGLTTSQMMTQANFTGWDFTNTWRIYEGDTYPLLKSFLTPLIVTANAATKTYDGLAYNGSGGVTYSVTPNMANLLGTLSYTGGTNVGAYTITPSGLYSNQQGYDISYANGALTVNPAPLAITGVSANNKVYDGTTTATLSNNGSLSGLVGSETLTLNAPTAIVFADKNAGTGKTVTSNGYTLADGTGFASNYQLASSSAATTADITPAPLTITANNASKTYDGLAYTGGNGVAYTGFVNGETSSVLGGVLAYGGTSQGAVNAGSYTITPSGQTSGNYNIAYVNGVLTVTAAPATITPAPVSTTTATTGTPLDYTSVIQEGLGTSGGSAGGQTEQPAKFTTTSYAPAELETFTFTSADNSRPLIIVYQLLDTKQRRCLRIRRN